MKKIEKAEILKELNILKEDFNIMRLLKIVEYLEEDVKKENYVTKPNDSKKYNCIRSIIKREEKSGRPILSSFMRYDGGVAFTDSYQAYILHDEYLPFDVASCNEVDDDLREYAKKYNLNIKPGIYPDLVKLITPEKADKEYKVNIKEYTAWDKSTPNESNSRRRGPVKIYTIEQDGIKITVNAHFINNAIKILKLKEDFTIKYKDEMSPLYIINESGEVALLMPTKHI